MAKVDILLPFWGDVGLLKKAVESVLAQTETDWNLLVFDDAYPSTEQMEYFTAINDPRIFYHRHETNIGITRNFNHAINAATAEHCILIGCDDMLLENYLDRALSRIGDADFYQPGVEVIDNYDTPYLPLGDRIKRLLQPRTNGIYEGERLAASLCTGNWLYFPSIMWKTQKIKKHGFDARYKIVEDVLLEMQIIIEGGHLYLDKEKTFQYRRSSQSLSSKEKSKDGVRFSEEDEVYENLSHTFAQMGWNKASRAAKLRVTSRLHRLIG